jgi:AraC-like DNA-binding protein
MQSFNQNFRDFINKYRIEESKFLLKNKSNGNKTILEIAYEVGFNSKSAFNAAFKKFTGLTPKEYRNGN